MRGWMTQKRGNRLRHADAGEMAAVMDTRHGNKLGGIFAREYGPDN